MRLNAAILFFALTGNIVSAQGQENLWPKLDLGEVKTIDDPSKIPVLGLKAAGIAATPQQPIRFTFFKAPHGHDFVIINPCCGKTGEAESLFERDGSDLRAIGLTMGDPRAGFTLQEQADDIRIDAGALALRARVNFANCEDGVWTYYYRFDEADKLILVSVIDTSCGHLGVRELYHAKNVDVGHWWMH